MEGEAVNRVVALALGEWDFLSVAAATADAARSAAGVGAEGDAALDGAGGGESEGVVVLKERGDLTGDDALQVVHRGKQIKVIITQERYFKLLGELAQRTVAEPGDLTADVPSRTRKQALKQKLEKASDGG